MTAVVLAGGRSRRMGRDKAALSLDGRELLERALDAAAEVAPDVVVAAGADAGRRADDLLRYGWREAPSDADGGRTFLRGEARATVVADARPGLGPVGGLETALGRARPGRAWVLACDLPHVTPALGTALLDRLEAGTRSAGTGSRPRAAVPRVGERLQPLCAAYDARAAGAARRCLDAGSRGMHELLALLEVDVVEEAELGHLGDPRRLFLNVNRPEDLWTSA